MRTLQALVAQAPLAAFICAQTTSNPCARVTITHVSQDIPCATVGRLVIGSDVSGDLDLVGLHQVGDLKVDGNKGLEYLTSKSLTRVESAVYLDKCDSLKELFLPNLTFVDTVLVNNTPKLNYIALGAMGTTAAGFVSIMGTAITQLDFHPASVRYLNIRENPRLELLSSNAPSLGVGGRFHLDAPSSSLLLPNLVWATKLDIRHAGHVNLQSLVSVNTSLNFQENNFTSLSLPVLETVGGGLTLINNSKLAQVDFPQLEKVGNLTMTDNPAIFEVDGFPKLAEASSGVVIDGDFKYIELPSLSNAAGGLWVTSSENISYSCAALETVFQSERPHQGFECQGAGDTLNNTGDSTVKGSPEGTTADQEGEDAASTASSSGALSGGAIAGIVIGVLAAVGILAAVIFLAWRRRSKAASAGGNTYMVDTSDLRGAKYAYAHPNAPELQGVPRAELATAAPELAGSKVNGTDTVYHEVDGTARGTGG